MALQPQINSTNYLRRKFISLRYQQFTLWNFFGCYNDVNELEISNFQTFFVSQAKIFTFIKKVVTSIKIIIFPVLLSIHFLAFSSHRYNSYINFEGLSVIDSPIARNVGNLTRKRISLLQQIFLFDWI